MSYDDLFRKRMALSGTTVRDGFKSNTVNLVNSKFADSPYYRQGMYNGNPIDIRIDPDKDDQTNTTKTFLLRPQTVVSRGDYITVDSNDWIVRDFNITNDIMPSAKMLLCNDVLKWKDGNGTIFSYPCTTIPYRSLRVIKDDSHDVNLPEGHMMVATKIDSNTKTIKIRQRFILGNQVYEITGVDDVNDAIQGIGMVTFTVGWVPKKDKDDFVNRIADNESLLGSKAVSTPTPAQTGQGGGLWS